MPTSEQLVWRALRMLSDDFRHAPAAMAWANRIVRQKQAVAVYLLSIGFTPRELSLGADPS
jgi:hypothetical protein